MVAEDFQLRFFMNWSYTYDVNIYALFFIHRFLCYKKVFEHSDFIIHSGTWTPLQVIQLKFLYKKNSPMWRVRRRWEVWLRRGTRVAASSSALSVTSRKWAAQHCGFCQIKKLRQKCATCRFWLQSGGHTAELDSSVLYNGSQVVTQ